MNCFFKYSILYYDETDRKEEVATGITYGTSLRDAISNLVGYYGDEPIIRILDFSYLYDATVLECKDAEFNIAAHFECDPSVE